MSEELPSAGRGAATAVISQFPTAVLPVLLEEVERSIASTVAVYLGSYGVNLDLARQIEVAPNRIYAPMFKIDEGGWYWRSRHPPPGPGDSSPYGGALPPLATILRSPQLDRLRWGIELGRRFRDELRRSAEQSGPRACWQFDEVKSECAGADGRPWRDFTSGILRGLHAGRRGQGDRSLTGIVWFAQGALRLASQALDREITQFWSTVSKNARFIVGEEYVSFRGSAPASARRFGLGHSALLHAGDQLRRELAARYLVGMTPGYNLSKEGLRGNVDHQSTSFVNRWRNAYVLERRRLSPRGFAQFDFTEENSDPKVIHDVIASLGRGVRS